MADLLRGPLIASLPLWYGEDTTFVINRIVPDSDPVEYVDYDEGTEARIIIDQPSSDITAEAVIVGHQATFVLLSTSTDNVTKGTLYRIQFTIPDVGNKVPIAGKVVRKGE